MRSREIARRYAEALYEVAAEGDFVDQIEDELNTTLLEVGDVPQFAQYLSHPLVTRRDKLALIQETFAGRSDVLQNTLALLVRNGREAYLDLMVDEFYAVRSEREHRQRVHVVTACELSDADRARLRERLETALGKDVRMDERIDPGVIGGIRVELDGKVLDGTVRARLSDLRSSLER